jgi:hypothetical protein
MVTWLRHAGSNRRDHNFSPLIFLRCFVTSVILSLFSGLPAEAVITLRVDQIGNDVIVSGSGKANLTALNFSYTSTSFQNVMTDIQIYAGPNLFASGEVDVYEGILTGPMTISSNPLLVEEPDAIASTGDLFGIITDPYQLVLPKNYLSNMELTGQSTYKNVTIADLGLSPGLGSWTWGSSANGSLDSINLVVVPGPLPVIGAATAFAWSRKLRRRALSSINR